VSRYAAGEIDLGRLTDELDALEEQAFSPENGGKGIRYSKTETAASSGTTRAAVEDVVQQITGKRSNWKVTTFDTVEDANAANRATSGHFEMLSTRQPPLEERLKAQAEGEARRTEWLAAMARRPEQNLLTRAGASAEE